MLTENWVTMNWQIQVLTDQRCAKHEQQFHRTKEKNLILKQGGFCQFCEAPTKFHANKYLTQRLTSAESETYFCLKLQTFSTSNKVHKKNLVHVSQMSVIQFQGLVMSGCQLLSQTNQFREYSKKTKDTLFGLISSKMCFDKNSPPSNINILNKRSIVNGIIS